MNNFIIIQNSVRTTFIFRSGYIKELLKYGTVTVIAPNDDHKAKGKLEEMGVTVEKISTNRILSVIQMNLIITKKRLQGAVFICHFLVSFLLCYITLVPFNRKLVIYTEGLGSIFSNSTFLQSVLRFFLVNNSAVRLFCNKSERELVGKKSDIVTNGIGVDLAKFKKKMNNVSGNPYQLLFVGRLISDKGVKDAIEAFRIIISKRRDVKLILVGDIYPNNPTSLTFGDIELLKKEFGSYISFVSFTETILDWYNCADILLLPSRREGFPVCVMEASSVGLPTVGFDVAGVRDAIKSGVNGQLVDYGDIDGLAKTIDSLLSTQTLSSYIDRSTDYAKKNFCNKEKNSQLVSILLNLCK
ncbi:glycosyltransferase [Vibrio alginolyticus]|uniref:glycosyltransferase n=1 Tax=Vibrio alginolyticus TaxID=663 RepID=UPI001BD39AFE|nr:glycosyltransferase [Vibrio alginolyticus]MBS9950498.1 glycosyltransferase [Vibrio alginolyticus]